MGAPVRLNKYLSSQGIASRRKVDELILQRKVEVNSEIVKDLGVKIDPEKDKVCVNGKVVQQEASSFVYLALNKPKGVISTASDEHGRKSVVDLVNLPLRLYPIGRLDGQSTGLILLTNDGVLANKLTHPKFHIPKTYLVVIEGYVPDQVLNQFREGVNLKDGKTLPAQVKIINRTKNLVSLEVILHEGRNRQIRRMCAALNLQLRELKREAIGPIGLKDLKIGQWRELSKEEVDSLRSS